ncbi:MAG: zinc-ribbon domain-containing protein [Lachnospiraceae bacterium]|nr:zinc-ribbon domain-containing protein [Lachnospiraceae bacterium]
MIFCPNCGSSYPDGTKFCSKCGSKLQEAAQPVQANPEPEIQAETFVRKTVKEKKAAPKLNLNPKLIAIAAAALALVILAVVFLPKLFSGNAGLTLRKDYVQSGKMGDSWIGFNKAGKVVKMESDESTKNGAMSADGTKNLLLDSEKTLFLFDGSKFTKIAEEVKSFLLSFDGKTVAYMDEESSVYLYAGGKAKKVAEDVGSLNAISPDGKAVAYTKRNNDTTRGYFYDGKERELGKNMTPVALSAKGTYVYYTNQSGVLYVQKGENNDDRQKIVDNVNNVIFNADGTQAVANDGSKTYFSEKAGERVEISKSVMRILLPARTMKDSRFVGVGSLKDQLYSVYASGDGYTVYRLNKKLETNSLVRNVFSLSLQEDGKTISYLKNEKLYLMNTSASDPEGKLLASNVESFVSAVNGKLFLYENEDKETFTVNTSGKSQKVVGESVAEWAAVGSGFLYVIDDELYFTSGGKGSKVSGLSDDVEDLESYRDYALIRCGDDAIYLTSDGKKLIKIYDGE